MDLPFPSSLCHQCEHVRIVRSGKGSVFIHCGEPSLPKYCSQPVVVCASLATLTPPTLSAPSVRDES